MFFISFYSSLCPLWFWIIRNQRSSVFGLHFSHSSKYLSSITPDTFERHLSMGVPPSLPVSVRLSLLPPADPSFGPSFPHSIEFRFMSILISVHPSIRPPTIFSSILSFAHPLSVRQSVSLLIHLSSAKLVVEAYKRSKCKPVRPKIEYH